jgi:hypothetical protein
MPVVLRVLSQRCTSFAPTAHHSTMAESAGVGAPSLRTAPARQPWLFSTSNHPSVLLCHSACAPVSRMHHLVIPISVLNWTMVPTLADDASSSHNGLVSPDI